MIVWVSVLSLALILVSNLNSFSVWMGFNGEEVVKLNPTISSVSNCVFLSQQLMKVYNSRQTVERNWKIKCRIHTNCDNGVPTSAFYSTVYTSHHTGKDKRASSTR